MISISHYLYRKLSRSAITVLLVSLSFAAPAAAQLRDRTHDTADPDQGQNQTKINTKKEKRGPRAIAVMEFLPGGGTRLVPIALWIDGHYYDASLYGANPEPMAVQPETLYEVMNNGEPTGWFTVTAPRQTNGNWFADGKWKPQLAMDAKLAEQAAKQPKPKPQSFNDDDDRPILHRSSSSSSGSNPPTSVSQGGNPSLSGPSSSSGSSASGSSSNSSQDKVATQSSSPDEYDPNRPVLRRGKPASEPSTAASASASPTTSATPTTAVKPTAMSGSSTAAAKNATSQPAYPAISDAGNIETRPLLYSMSENERQQKAGQMVALAIDSIRNFASKRIAPALPANATLNDYDLRAYDLDFSNSPTLVLTGKLHVENPGQSPEPTRGPKASHGTASPALHTGSLDYFVTVVARVDINGTAQKIFASVTDSNYLDAFPRMQIIDAVDADANGRGDLLFRQYSDNGISYALFRVYPYQMVKIFEGGASM